MNILIVDDEEEIREMLGRHLLLLDYNVDKAADGMEALQIMAAKRIDVLVTDLRMPRMDGIELMRAMRTEAPMVRTIVLTSFTTLENALNCMRLRAETFIFKPIEDLKELEDAIANIEVGLKLWQRKLRKLRGMETA